MRDGAYTAGKTRGRAATPVELRSEVTLLARTAAAVVVAAALVTGAARPRTLQRPEGAVVTTKRSGVVTTATRQ
jgi:hypothetical protein